LLGLVLFQYSCVSLNTHQSGRTLGKDNFSIYGNYNYIDVDSSQVYNDLSESRMPVLLEVGMSYGITDKYDMGLKINSSSHATWINKIQIIGNQKSKFASSVGIDLGLSPLAFAGGVFTYSGSIVWINSIHPKDNIAITLSPRYSHFGLFSFGAQFNSNITGYSTSLIIGKKHQLSFEIGQFVANNKFSFNTRPVLGIGYTFNLMSASKSLRASPKER